MWNSKYITGVPPRTPRPWIVLNSSSFGSTVLTLLKRRHLIASMSDCSGSPSDHMESQPPKRKATTAGLDGVTVGRSVKRRASKACQCCRARKVRCNVTEHGAPCTNCRLDEVDCIVSESRRKKSVTHRVQHPTTPRTSTISTVTHFGGISRIVCSSSFKSGIGVRSCQTSHLWILPQLITSVWTLSLHTIISILTAIEPFAN